MKIALLVLSLLFAGLAVLVLRRGADLKAQFDKRRLALTPGASAAPLTDADIAHLPAPVQRYLRRAGAIGKPPVTLIHTIFDATLYNAPGSAGLSGPAHQIDVLDPPRRLFFMTSRMYGLPVAVLHDYSGETASMKVRIARIFNVVDITGPNLAKTETVTFLNDLCAYAPSALVRPEFIWTAIDDTHAGVAYTTGAITVAATLEFSRDGDLVNFASDDRGELQRDGSLKIQRWSTPFSDYAGFQGRRIATRGKAVSHRPEGPFAYGEFKVTGYAAE